MPPSGPAAAPMSQNHEDEQHANGREAVDGRHEEHGQGGEGLAPQVSHFQRLEGRTVPAQANQGRGGRDEQEHHEPSEEGEVDALPHGRPDAARAASRGVMGDEGQGVASGNLEQAEWQPDPHDGGKGCGHRPGVVSGQEDRVHEHLDGHETLAHDQRGSPTRLTAAGRRSRPWRGLARE
jgi:hypothetical protein